MKQKNKVEQLKEIQEQKRRRLEKEISWVKHEFENFSTLNDIEIYDVEGYSRHHLGIKFI